MNKADRLICILVKKADWLICILVNREPCVWLPVPSDKDKHILDYKKLETVFQAEKTDMVEEVGHVRYSSPVS